MQPLEGILQAIVREPLAEDHWLGEIGDSLLYNNSHQVSAASIRQAKSRVLRRLGQEVGDLLD